MRFFSIILLVSSFVLGIVSALSLAHYTIDAKPLAIAETGPTIKILTAKNSIPKGALIGAADILYTEITVAELPKEAVTDFLQVNKRQAAYDISVGCPLCEDLLVPKMPADSEARFIKPGLHRVALEIDVIQPNQKNALPAHIVSQFLQPGKRIDVYCLPKDEPQGEWARKKMAVLAQKATKNWEAEAGPPLLENVEIAAVQNHVGATKNTLSLILEKEELSRLETAAKTGRLRVSLRDEPSRTETRQEEPPQEEDSLTVTIADHAGQLEQKDVIIDSETPQRQEDTVGLADAPLPPEAAPSEAMPPETVPFEDRRAVAEQLVSQQSDPIQDVPTQEPSPRLLTLTADMPQTPAVSVRNSISASSPPAVIVSNIPHFAPRTSSFETVSPSPFEAVDRQLSDQENEMSNWKIKTAQMPIPQTVITESFSRDDTALPRHASVSFGIPSVSLDIKSVDGSDSVQRANTKGAEPQRDMLETPRRSVPYSPYMRPQKTATANSAEPTEPKLLSGGFF